MCGIVGYVGNKNAQEVLISGLKSLEYRGYDSSGIAYTFGKKINIIKCEGKVANLEEKLDSKVAEIKEEPQVKKNKLGPKILGKIELSQFTTTSSKDKEKSEGRGHANNKKSKGNNNQQNNATHFFQFYKLLL